MEKIYFDLDFIKKEELKILIIFDEICRDNDIEYSLSGGTLLGAIRHKGFIPWDDDVDVMMTRENFEKFFDVFKNNKNGNLFLQNYESDSLYLNNFAKLVNTEITAYLAETEDLDIVRGICIDIFPIDRITENKVLQFIYKLKMSIFSFLKYSCLKKESESIISKAIYGVLSKFAKLIGLSKINTVENRLRKRWLNTNYNSTFADYIKPPYKLRDKDILPYDIFESYTDIIFEGHNFRVIENYVYYLESVYGDYMKLPDEDKRKPDHNFYHY